MKRFEIKVIAGYLFSIILLSITMFILSRGLTNQIRGNSLVENEDKSRDPTYSAVSDRLANLEKSTKELLSSLRTFLNSIKNKFESNQSRELDNSNVNTTKKSQNQRINEKALQDESPNSFYDIEPQKIDFKDRESTTISRDNGSLDKSDFGVLRPLEDSVALDNYVDKIKIENDNILNLPAENFNEENKEIKESSRYIDKDKEIRDNLKKGDDIIRSFGIKNEQTHPYNIINAGSKDKKSEDDNDDSCVLNIEKDANSEKEENKKTELEIKTESNSIKDDKDLIDVISDPNFNTKNLDKYIPKLLSDNSSNSDPNDGASSKNKQIKDKNSSNGSNAKNVNNENSSGMKSTVVLSKKPYGESIAFDGESEVNGEQKNVYINKFSDSEKEKKIRNNPKILFLPQKPLRLFKKKDANKKRFLETNAKQINVNNPYHSTMKQDGNVKDEINKDNFTTTNSFNDNNLKYDDDGKNNVLYSKGISTVKKIEKVFKQKENAKTSPKNPKKIVEFINNVILRDKNPLERKFLTFYLARKLLDYRQNEIYDYLLKNSDLDANLLEQLNDYMKTISTNGHNSIPKDENKLNVQINQHTKKHVKIDKNSGKVHKRKIQITQNNIISKMRKNDNYDYNNITSEDVKPLNIRMTKEEILNEYSRAFLTPKQLALMGMPVVMKKNESLLLKSNVKGEVKKISKKETIVNHYHTLNDVIKEALKNKRETKTVEGKKT